MPHRGLFAEGGLLSPKSTLGRTVAGATAALLVAAGLVVGAVVAPGAMADDNRPVVGISGSGIDTNGLLAGENETLKLSVKNAGGEAWYNLSFVAEMPVGVAFVAEGSDVDTPLMYGPGSKLPDGSTVPAGKQLWVWQDLSDLPAGAARELSVVVTPAQPASPQPGNETNNRAVFPVGSLIDIKTNAYVSKDARYIPIFPGSTGKGGDDAKNVTVAGESKATTTEVKALEVTKTEPSPEAELMRGVHNSTVYTVNLKNTKQGATDNVVLVDYLHAGLEYLGCGTEDNTANGRVEYDGAGRLDATTPDIDPCEIATEVVTVVKPTAGIDFPATLADGVYTRVTWTLGTLAAGESLDVKYAVGIPLQMNTVDWSNGVDPSALGATGQGANLDNNNGASTRQGATSGTGIDGMTFKNVAAAGGQYAGVIRTDTSRDTWDSDDEIVHSMDLRVLKSVDTKPTNGDPTDFATQNNQDFRAGEVAKYTLNLKSSEYTSSDKITLYDVIPNGLCPILPVGTAVHTGAISIPELDGGANTDLTGAASLPADCAPGTKNFNSDWKNPAFSSNVDIEWVAYDEPSGSFILKMTVVPMDSSSQAATNPTAQSIVYPVLMRGSYSGAEGTTSSLDPFTNTVTMTATSTGQYGAEFGKDRVLADDSAASIVAGPTTISKKVLPRDVNLASNACPADPTKYVDKATGENLNFVLGDTVCYQLTVNFAQNAETRNPVVTDMMPAGITYVGSNAKLLNKDDSEVTPAVKPGFQAGAGNTVLNWAPSTHTSGDGDRLVPRGTRMVISVWGTVTTQSADAQNLDKPENLMKYQQSNVKGDVFFDRKQVSTTLDAGLQLKKGVRSVKTDPLRDAETQDNASGDEFNSNRDGVQVAEAEKVVYRIDLSGAPQNITNLTVEDRLPAGIAEKDVDKTGLPSGVSFETRGSVTYMIWSNVTVHKDTDKSLQYTVTIPRGTSIGTKLNNTASITSYTFATNDGKTSDPIEPGKNGVPTNGTSDSSEVFLPSATVSKRVVSTDVSGMNNNGTGTITNPEGEVVAPLPQAVHGEYITYEYSVTIPANSSVKGGVLKDAGSLMKGATAGRYVVDASRTKLISPAGLPAGFVLNDATGTLAFPGVYDNDTPADVTFTVQISAYTNGPDDTATEWAHGDVLTNTANFTSDDTPQLDASADVKYLAPAPKITKAVAGDAGVDGVLTYTLTLSNPTGSVPPRATLFDTVATDCVPAGLTVLPDTIIVTGNSGTVVSGPPVLVDGCETSPGVRGTKITWVVDILPAGGHHTLTYKAKVSPNAAGASKYKNIVNFAGNVLDNVPGSDPRQLVLTGSAEATAKVAGATLAKGVSPSSAAIGETVTYSVAVKIPAKANFYDTKIVDAMPAGVEYVAGSSRIDSCDSTVIGGCDVMPTLTGPSVVDGATVWSLGDIASFNGARTFTIEYKGKLTDAIAKPVPPAGLTNTAYLSWNTRDGDDTSVTKSPDAKAKVTVLEPKLTINKLVHGNKTLNVEPGTPLLYDLVVTNSGTSDAYAMNVVDEVPEGIFVDASTISDGGVLSGSTAKGGGTITWSASALNGLSHQAPNNTRKLTYSATHAASIDVTDTQKFTNVAKVTSYTSQPTDGRSYGPSADTQAVVGLKFPKIDLTKATAGTNVAYRGLPFGWALSATNNGDGLAHTVTLVDTLPEDWSYTARTARVTVAGGTAFALEPVLSGRTLTWTFDSSVAGFTGLKQNQKITIDFSATPGATAKVGSGFDHKNLIDATFTDASGATGNGTGDYESAQKEAIAKIHSADLQLEKVAGADLATGTSGTGWTITVKNDGPDVAVGPFTIIDTPTLPAGVTVTGATGKNWACAVPVADGSFSCARTNATETLASKASFEPITVTVAVAATVASGTIVPNRAEVVGKTHDPKFGNNIDTANLTITTVADLGIDKALAGSAPNAGGTISWTITATNHGPSDSVSSAAKPITVTDTIPLGVNGATADLPTGWTATPKGPWAAGTKVVFTAPDGAWAANTAAVVTLNGTVDAGWAEGAALTNTAEVTPGITPEPTTPVYPNTDHETVTPTTDTSLAINKSRVVKVDGKWVAAGSSDVPVAGAEVNYLIEVKNLGLADAVGVSVEDVLPSYLSFVGYSDVVGTWTTTDNANFALDGTLLTAAAKPAGSDTASFVLTAKVSSGHTSNVVNAATASASNSTNEPEDDDDSSSTRRIDLSITKSHTGAAIAGGQLPYTLTVTNNGPSDTAGPFTVVDELPAGFSYVADSSEVVVGGKTMTVTPTVSGQSVLWTIGDADTDLPAGATIVITLNTNIAVGIASTAYTNTATVTGNDPDTNPFNNSASDTVSVGVQTDASVNKSVVGTGPFVAGTDVSYTIDVTVAGPSTARQVRIEDLVPAGLTIKSIGAADGSDGWVWSGNAGTRAALAPGTYTIPVVATINENVVDGATLTNTAKLSWTDGSGPRTDDDPADITVTANADLALAKTAVDEAGDPVQFVLAGTQGRYLMQVTNHGPSQAVAPLTIIDTLPAGLSYAAVANPLDWSCTAGANDPVAGQTVTCVSTATASLANGADAAPLDLLVQFDVNMPAGDFINKAQVSSPTDEGADTHSNKAEATVTTKQAPSITLDKVATTANAGSEKVGDKVSYTFTAKNTGNVTLIEVTIADHLAGLSGLDYTWPDANFPGVLLQGETVTAQATLTLTQAHFDAKGVVNNALASGTSPALVVVNDPATATVTLPQSPSITIDKTSALRAGAIGIEGDTVNYRFVVTNTGNLTLTDVSVSDPLITAGGITFGAWPTPAKPGTLAPGESVEATASYVLTQADVDNGAVVNRATTGGKTPDGTPVDDDDTETTPTGGTSALSLVKTGAFAKPAGAVLGGSAVYTFVITNTGTVTVHDAAITDPIAGLSPVTYVWPGVAGVLAPGQFATASADLTLTQAHIDAGVIDNTARVDGKDPHDASVPPAHDSEQLLIASAPSIALTKTGALTEVGASQPGQLVAYTFEAVNTGNVTLSGVTIDDPKVGLSVLGYTWPDTNNPGVLLPDQKVIATANYALVQADIEAGKVDNTAVATGTPPIGADVTDDDSTTVKPKQETGITLDKSAAFAVDGALGDTVNYTFTAVNTSNITLTGVTISDALPGLSALDYTWPNPGQPGVLLRGESVTATASYTVTQDDVDAGQIVNTATVTGNGPDAKPVSSTDDAIVNPPQNPAIYLVKDGALAAAATGVAGDLVEYSFTVTNSGTVTLHNVMITDPKAGLSALTNWVWPDAAGTLLVGESATATATYTLTQSDVDAGTVLNMATASGTPTGGTPVRWSDDATITVTPAPSIDLVKTGVFTGAAGGVLGETVEYGFTVTNTGSVTLHDVSIADAMPGLSAVTYGAWPAAEGTLLPGETVTATASVVLTQVHMDAGEIVNGATASGVPPTGAPVDDSDSVTLVITETPLIGLAKKGVLAVDGAGAVGDTVLFEMVASNTGNVTLYDTEIVDPMPGLSALTYSGWPTTPGVLAPGESVTVTASYKLTAADVSNGFITNTATAYGRSKSGGVAAGGVEVEQSSTAKVTVPPASDLSKTGFDPLPLTGGAALLLGLGALLLYTRRRRAVS